MTDVHGSHSIHLYSLYSWLLLLVTLFVTLFDFVAPGKSYFHEYSPTRSNLTFIVFGAWVGPEPHDVKRLNHKAYCDHHGYDYRYFYLNESQYVAEYGQISPLWYKVFAAKSLVNSGEADYYFYVDIDCLFARIDVPLESLIDTSASQVVQLTQPGNIVDLPCHDKIVEEPPSPTRFIGTHQFVLKQSVVSMNFLNQWLWYLKTLTCKDISGEQGAVFMVLGNKLSDHHKKHLNTHFGCPDHCHNKNRRSYTHYTCVLDWFELNGFGYRQVSRPAPSNDTHTHTHTHNHNHTSTSTTPSLTPPSGARVKVRPGIDHPQILVHDPTLRYSYLVDRHITHFNNHSYVADSVFSATVLHFCPPFDAMVSQLQGTDVPVMLHPCKSNPYSHPSETLKECTST